MSKSIILILQLGLCLRFLIIRSPYENNNVIFRYFNSLIKNFDNHLSTVTMWWAFWNTTTVVNYIAEMNTIDELTNWTVALFSNSAKGQYKDVQLSDFVLKPLKRKNQVSENVMTVSRSNIMNETSERLDFSEDEIKELKNKDIKTKARGFSPSEAKRASPFDYFSFRR